MAINQRIIGIIPKTKKSIIRSPHFWLLLVITFLIMSIYQVWPWREWSFSDGVLRWFTGLSSLYSLGVFEFQHHFIGILLMLPIVYATIVYKWPGALIVSLLSLTYLVLEVGVGLWSDVASALTNACLLLLPAAIIVAVTIEMELRRRDRRILAEREEQRKAYLSKVYEAQENERRRIAQELHDDTIQTFLLMAKRAQNMVAETQDSLEVKGNAAYIRDTALQAVEDVRRLSLDLRPSILDDLGMLPALRWLVDRMNRESGIRTRITINNSDNKLSPQAEVIAFRIVQEALQNIKHHSQAREAVITLEFDSESLKMTIRDDGQGFTPPRKLSNLLAEGKLGLIGMRERIESINGKLKIHSKPLKGTLLSIYIPY